MGMGFPERKGGAHKIASSGAGAGNPLISRMTEPLLATIASLYRYPVKGLTPEPLPRTNLSPGQTLKADRRYAIENGPSGFDPAAPKWLPKPHFLMLQRDEWLAPQGWGISSHARGSPYAAAKPVRGRLRRHQHSLVAVDRSLEQPRRASDGRSAR